MRHDTSLSARASRRSVFSRRAPTPSDRVRLRVSVPKYEPREEAAPPMSRSAADAVKGARKITLNGTMTDATLYERDRLDIGAMLGGPAIVEQLDATTVIPAGWSARVDATVCC